MSSIIPIEVAHNLIRMSELDKNAIEQLIISFISLDNCQLIDINQILVLEALNFLKKLASRRIGGRDALILATMNKYQVETIVTHDKNLLSLRELSRIDPFFDPSLKLQPEEEFDSEYFKSMIQEQL